MEHVAIFDTTLRDGEQSPGCSLTFPEKIEIAHQLARLGVDVIEAGFPISSPGDFQAVQTIARQVKGPMITGLGRAVEKDIDAVWEAVKDAERKQIHIVLSVSDIHIDRKLRSNRADVLKQGIAAVKYARQYCDEVEYSPEDAGRADPEYLYETIHEVIKAGATVVNIPDTTGYVLPSEWGELIANVFKNVPNAKDAVISVHCHNDLGNAVANSVAAILNGARRVECTINGIGERAGNASLEEIVMTIKKRLHAYGFDTGVDTTQLVKTSRLVSTLMSMPVQANKAIVGANAFAHASGIHQDGVLKDRLNYEIMTPDEVGWVESNIVLTARSGRHAFQHRLEKLGFVLSREDLRRPGTASWTSPIRRRRSPTPTSRPSCPTRCASRTRPSGCRPSTSTPPFPTACRRRPSAWSMPRGRSWPNRPSGPGRSTRPTRPSTRLSACRTS